MRITDTPATQVETTSTPDGGTYTVTPAGTTVLAGSKFSVQIATYTNAEGVSHSDTHLIGARGSMYLLRTTSQSGVFQVISLNTGAPWRKHGNEIRVVQLGNIIEQLTK